MDPQPCTNCISQSIASTALKFMGVTCISKKVQPSNHTDNSIIGISVVVLSHSEMRKRYIGTTLPHYIKKGHSSLNPQGKHDQHYLDLFIIDQFNDTLSPYELCRVIIWKRRFDNIKYKKLILNGMGEARASLALLHGCCAKKKSIR